MVCVGEEEVLEFQPFALMFFVKLSVHPDYASQDNNENFHNHIYTETKRVQKTHAWIPLILGTYKNFTHLICVGKNFTATS